MLLLAAAAPAGGQLAPPSTGGYPAFHRVLQQLTESRRVLVIGAHPDDEDTGLLTLMARGRGARAAYLSLSRGEGGQNLIGDELGVALGILRTRELEAARAIDGAEQYFTRAYDFGYTRSLAETERCWPPDTLLKDVVRVVRRFRPHVIVSVFSGTSRDGHGQHQMAGVLARRAYAVAGDGAAFPELASEEELIPWTPLKLYRSTRFDSAATTLTLPLGGIDPLTGKTYRQIAAESRSQHRSQDFGSIQALGPAESRLRLVETRVTAAADADIFAGIPADTSWLVTLADSLRRHITAATMDAAVTRLADAAARLPDRDPAGRAHLVTVALAAAAGLVLDARVERSQVVPGESLGVEVEVYNAGASPVRVARAGSGGLGDGHHLILFGPELAGGLSRTYRAPLGSEPGMPPTQPYYLVHARAGALYDWRGVPPSLRGLPFEGPPVTGAAEMEVRGAAVLLVREASLRVRDQAVGEVRTPLRVVPRLDVRLSPERRVWPAGGPAAQTFTVTVRNNGRDTVTADVSLEIGGWPAPPPQRVRLDAGVARDLMFPVRRPDGPDRARTTIRAVARTGEGTRFTEGAVMVDYPHIRPTQWMREADGEVIVAPIRLPDVRRVGYVRGASDRVPEALEGVGLPLELIGRDTLAHGDLSRFDVIVVGSRAYETDTALTAHHHRLLAWVREGGRLVVQYQQYDFVRGGYAPYRLAIGFPHDRITDETAPVTLLRPDHPIFERPNDIGAADWEGWVQERGLYFPNEWAPEYSPLLEMQDPDRPAYRGGLLVARYGEGSYIYTGLSFFRELPAGIVGAFRLFLNLLAWDGTDADG